MREHHSQQAILHKDHGEEDSSDELREDSQKVLVLLFFEVIDMDVRPDSVAEEEKKVERDCSR